MHPLARLRRDGSGDVDRLIWILQLHRKPANHPGHRAPQLRACKVLADARPLAMQEGDLREVGRCAAVVVHHLVALLVRVDPPLRPELLARLAPEVRTAVDRVRAEDDARAPGDLLACHVRIAHRLADRRRHRRVQPQHFLADAVEQRHRLELVPGDGVVGRGDYGTDLLPESGLDVGMQAQQIAGPCQGAGRGFVLGVSVSYQIGKGER